MSACCDVRLWLLLAIAADDDADGCVLGGKTGVNIGGTALGRIIDDCLSSNLSKKKK